MPPTWPCSWPAACTKIREVAEQLAGKLREVLGERARDVTIAGPGFVNINLSDRVLAEQALAAPTTKPAGYEGQVVVAEYSDPNPFKVLHAGHFYTSVVGAAIGSLMERSGATVTRVNYGGSVGLH